MKMEQIMRTRSRLLICMLFIAIGTALCWSVTLAYAKPDSAAAKPAAKQDPAAAKRAAAATRARDQRDAAIKRRHDAQKYIRTAVEQQKTGGAVTSPGTAGKEGAK